MLRILLTLALLLILSHQLGRWVSDLNVYQTVFVMFAFCSLAFFVVVFSLKRTRSRKAGGKVASQATKLH